MAKPTVLPGTDLLLLLGDGSSPELFVEPCGLTTKSFDLAASTNTNLIPDCTNPSAPAWETTDVSGLSCSGAGNGLMAVEAFNKFNAWFLSAQAKNMQIKLDHPGLGYYEGSFILTSFKLSGTRGNKILVDMAFKSDGEVTWVDNP